MRSFWDILKRLHRSEQGAEGLEKLLIIAVIVLPLLAVLFYFREWIVEWVRGEAYDLRNRSDTDPGGF